MGAGSNRYHGSRQRGAVGAGLVAYLSNPFNRIEMKKKPKKLPPKLIKFFKSLPKEIDRAVRHDDTPF